MPLGPMCPSVPANPRQEPDPRRYLKLAPQPPEQGDIDVRELFPGRTDASGPYELEIGFGRGMFLIERAQAASNSAILGLEIKRKWAYLVAERARRLGLGEDRVRVFGADARDVLPRLSPEGSFARVFMHFPDPWWKKRHTKRRLSGPAFFDPIARLLCPGGELFIQTDVEERAECFVADVREHGAFDVSQSYVEGNPYQARSNREKRAIEDGLPVFRILARRR